MTMGLGEAGLMGHKRSRNDVPADNWKGIDAGRMTEIRLRIASGYYMRPSVLSATAERMLKNWGFHRRPGGTKRRKPGSKS